MRMVRNFYPIRAHATHDILFWDNSAVIITWGMKSIHDPRYSEFIEHLIAARLKQKVSQEKFFQSLARPQSYIARVENLDRRIEVVETRDRPIALGVSPASFMYKILWWSERE